MHVARSPDQQPFPIITETQARHDRCSRRERPRGQDRILDVNAEERLLVELLDVVHHDGRAEIQGDSKDGTGRVVGDARMPGNVQQSLRAVTRAVSQSWDGFMREDGSTHLRARRSQVP